MSKRSRVVTSVDSDSSPVKRERRSPPTLPSSVLPSTTTSSTTTMPDSSSDPDTHIPFASGSQPNSASTSTLAPAPLPVAPPLINDINRSYQFADSDCTLVALDDLHFKVHTFRMAAASPVFQAQLFPTNDGRPIHCPEPSRTIKLFLDLVYGEELKAPLTKEETNEMDRLFGCLTRLKATTALTAFRLSVRAWAGTRLETMSEMFMLGCDMNDTSTIKKSLYQGAAGTFGPFPEGQVHDVDSCGIEGARIMELTAMPYSMFKRIPDRHKWAILRALRAQETEKSRASRDWSTIASHYERNLNALDKAIAENLETEDEQA